MKILFNRTIINPNNFVYKKNNKDSQKSNHYINANVKVSNPSYQMQLINNGLSFRGNHDTSFLLNQYKRLRCAYSGKIMLSPNEYKDICQKILKRPNAQSAINLLQNFIVYMDDIEAIIFDIFKEASHKCKRSFKDILMEEAPEAKIRLKEKQIKVLNRANKLIDSMSEPIAEQVRQIRDEALLDIENDVFGRKSPLEKIKQIIAKGDDLSKVIKVYQLWYQSPASGKDLDAFIVKYSKRTHEQIALRLISGAVASIEHIVPKSRNGGDSLGNFLLVRAQYNNTRSSMPLSEYIQLNQEINIPKNLQIYVDDVVHQVNDKKSPFNKKPNYIIKVIETLKQEAGDLVDLKHSPIHFSHQVLHQDEIFAKKLSKKYNVV